MVTGTGLQRQHLAEWEFVFFQIWWVGSGWSRTSEAWTVFPFLLCPTHKHSHLAHNTCKHCRNMHRHTHAPLPTESRCCLLDSVVTSQIHRLNSIRQRRPAWPLPCWESVFFDLAQGAAVWGWKWIKSLPALHFLDSVLFYPLHTVTFKIRTPIIAHRKSANAILIWIVDTVGLAVIRAPFKWH